MLKIELWRPCLSCPFADIVVHAEDITTCGHGEIVCTKHVISCERAPVCRSLDGAMPLIGGDAPC